MPNLIDEFESMGADIGDAVSNAVRTGDYSHLSSDIQSLVGQTLDSVGITTRASQRQMRGGTQPHYASQRGVRQAAPDDNIISGKAREVFSQPVYGPDGQPVPQARMMRSARGPRLVKDQTATKVLSILGAVCGYTALIGLFPIFLVAVFSGDAPEGLAAVFGFMNLLFLSLGVSCTSMYNRVGRFESYIKALRGRTYGSLAELGSFLGKDAKFALRDLRWMIRKGWFTQGHIDVQETTLITSDETYRQYVETQNTAERERLQAEEAAKLAAAEQARQAAEMDEELAKLTPLQREMIVQGNQYIAQIRSCNDRIPGEEMSAKLSRLENSTTLIMERAKTDPKYVDNLRRLMSYYLPTAVKLLNAYADLEAQPMSTQNIEKSKREIEATIDALNDAFQKIFDDMFTDTNLDISTDAEVLQQVLQNEGLLGDQPLNQPK
ncbi:MAG: 5-bromo-4-chloroindolyl phosphate hydrolysis family protein [Lachnospiraceae bacterium]|nr:5-bromo-4-chloroindolyl phosphate hydrolysis family protein [Lachnospiraceae bacterium]